MDDMMLLASEYVFGFALIGLVSGLYLSCFLQIEKLELKKFIQNEIQRQLKNS